MTESENRYLPWKEFWGKRVNDLEKLKKCNHDLWREILNKCHPFLNPFRDNVSKIEKKIRNLPELIDDLIKNIEEDYVSPTKIKGTPPKKLNILFLVWSNLIKDNTEVHFQTLLSLLRWFSIRTRLCHEDGEEFNLYYGEEDVEDDNLHKLLFRYKRNKLKQPKEEVDIYKKRFFIPVNNHWLENNFNDIRKLNMPIIIFSNGEKLTINDCRDNNPYLDTHYSKKKKRLPPIICLDFELYRSDLDSWLFWQLQVLRCIDKME